MQHFLFLRLICGIFAFNLIGQCREDREREKGIGSGKVCEPGLKAAYKAIGTNKTLF